MADWKPCHHADAPFACEVLQFRVDPTPENRTRMWLNAVMQADPLRAARELGDEGADGAMRMR